MRRLFSGWLLALSAASLIGAAASAQQQTIVTFTSSQGRSSISRARSLSQTTALDGGTIVNPGNGFIADNVRPIQRPDGSTALQIVDPARPFGSYSESVSREREETSKTLSVTTFSGYGYSVFHP